MGGARPTSLLQVGGARADLEKGELSGELAFLKHTHTRAHTHTHTHTHTQGLDNPDDFQRMFNQIEVDPLRPQNVLGDMDFDVFD